MHGTHQETPRRGRTERAAFALQMAEQAERVGGRISELRQERGWSKAEMARRMEGLTSGNDVSRWEKGQHLPRSDTLEAIASLLDTTVADLYAGPIAQRESAGPTPDLLGALDGDTAEQLAAIRADLKELLEGQARIEQTQAFFNSVVQAGLAAQALPDADPDRAPGEKPSAPEARAKGTRASGR